jgi:aldose 1-epimerase
MQITHKLFGTTQHGIDVLQYTITNESGAYVSILTLGGIIREIVVPDSEGILNNVALGYDCVQHYEKDTAFLGAAIGRSAGRISNATITIDTITYPLSKNNGENNLHGGPNGFDKQVWDASEYVTKDQASLVLNYRSPDMEEGFPGELDCTITYSFNNNHELTLKYICTTDKKTFVNLTNHCYFNLSGDFTKTHYNHSLQINAPNYVETDAASIPTGIASVTNTPFDFTTKKAIGLDIDSNNQQIVFGQGYDHPFVLDKTIEGPCVVVSEPTSGRIMEVYTDEACVVFYSGNFLTDRIPASGNISIVKRSAFCLETQYYPDALNAPFIPSKFLEPGQFYRTSTTYKFST